MIRGYILSDYVVSVYIGFSKNNNNNSYRQQERYEELHTSTKEVKFSCVPLFAQTEVRIT